MTSNAEQVASESSDSSHPAPTDAKRQENSDPHKMEDDLTREKENKVHTTEPDQVAGREGKGSFAPTKLVGKVKEGIENKVNATHGKNY